MKKIVSAISTFFYQLGQGFLGLFRSGMSISSILALVCCMVVLGTFYILIDLIEVNFRQIDDMNVIEVTLSNTYDEDKISAIGEEIGKLQDDETLGVIESYEYLSKADNWQRFIAWNDSDGDDGATGILSEYFDETNNPLSPSYRIKFASFTNKDKLYELKYRIGNIDGVSPDDISENFTLYEKVTNVKNAITITGVWIMAILFIVTVLFIINTLKLGIKSRSNEIMFMRYCGATGAFISTPFVVEGLLIGLISAAIALGLQYYVYNYILADIFTEYSIGTVGTFDAYLPFVTTAFVVIGLVAGVIGSSMCIKKYLKV